MTRAAIAAAVALAIGCGAPSPPALHAGLPSAALRVPLVRQATTYSCGAAALLAILYYWKRYDGSESSLYAELGTSEEDGTQPGAIVRVARRFGLSAEVLTGLSLADLRRLLADGATVILDIQAWREDTVVPWSRRWDDGHYVILVAMDDRRVYVMDPSAAGAYGWLPQAELLERWRDYEEQGGRRIEYVRAGIVIRGPRPPGPLPLVRVE